MLSSRFEVASTTSAESGNRRRAFPAPFEPAARGGNRSHRAQPKTVRFSSWTVQAICVNAKPTTSTAIGAAELALDMREDRSPSAAWRSPEGDPWLCVPASRPVCPYRGTPPESHGVKETFHLKYSPKSGLGLLDFAVVSVGSVTFEFVASEPRWFRLVRVGSLTGPLRSFAFAPFRLASLRPLGQISKLTGSGLCVIVRLDETTGIVIIRRGPLERSARRRPLVSCARQARLGLAKVGPAHAAKELRLAEIAYPRRSPAFDFQPNPDEPQPSRFARHFLPSCTALDR
jgi:hypothetical protein